VRVQFLGSGTPLGQGGRLQACILLTSGRTRIALDFGLTSLVALARAGLEPHSLDAILVSHLHGDHFGGLPLLLLDAFVRADSLSPRRRPLLVAGPPATAERVRQALEVFGWAGAWTHARQAGYVQFVTLPEQQPTEVAGFQVTAFAVPHNPATAPHALRLTAAGTTITYSGDAGWTDSLPELAAGADLFICGVWSFDTSDPTFLDFRTLVEHRAELACRRLVLTHLGPSMLEHRAEVAANGFELAEDGLTLVL
jgi:ribonuclease BN (tRNA processing enzyme)